MQSQWFSAVVAFTTVSVKKRFWPLILTSSALNSSTFLELHGLGFFASFRRLHLCQAWADHLPDHCVCVSACDFVCVWSYLGLSVFTFRAFTLSCKSVRVFRGAGFAVLTHERHPTLTGAEKRISAGLKKKKKKRSRHAWQQQYKNTSFLTCFSGPVWCDMKHHRLRGKADSWKTCTGTAQSNSYHFSWHTMYHLTEKKQHLHLT